MAALRAAGATVEHVVTVVDREEGAAEAFAAEGITLHALFRKSEFAAKELEASPEPATLNRLRVVTISTPSRGLPAMASEAMRASSGAGEGRYP